MSGDIPMVYTGYSGGLGDTFGDHFRPGSDAGRWAAARWLWPGLRIVAVFCNVNPASVDLVRNHPDIDQAFWSEFEGDHPRGLAERGLSCPSFREVFADVDLPWEFPFVDMDPAERWLFDAIRAGGPYVCVHPFAGTADRNLSTGVDLRKVTVGIAATGMPAVFLGGSSSRWVDGREWKLDEANDDALVGHHHLVGRLSPRVQAMLVRHAAAFVGTYSAYAVMAGVTGVPALVFAPPAIRARGRDAEKAGYGLAGARFRYWDEPLRVADEIAAFLMEDPGRPPR